MTEALALGSQLQQLFDAERLFNPNPEASSEDDVIQLALLIDRLQLKHSLLIAAAVRQGDWEPDHTPCSWLRNEAHLGWAAACARIDVGEQAAGLPLSIQAMARGELGFAHLAELARVAGHVGEGFDERPLLERALKQNPSRFRKTCSHHLHAQNPQWYAEQERRAREYRQLEISGGVDGCAYLRGWLEPEGASVVRAALEALAEPGGADDDRSRKQRLGDALVELAGKGVHTELLVTMPVETFLGLRGAPAAETEWGGLLSSELVQRFLCHSTLRRVVMDERNVLLDLGRRHRVITPRARRALVARDRHCVWPGCDRPVAWCQSHHTNPWRQGGTTDVNHMATLCRRHHTRADEGWALIQNEQGDWHVIPPHPFWLDPTPG